MRQKRFYKKTLLVSILKLIFPRCTEYIGLNEVPLGETVKGIINSHLMILDKAFFGVVSETDTLMSM